MQKQPPTVATPDPRSSTRSACDNRTDVERVVKRIIAAKTRRLVDAHRFRRDDYEDIVQELHLEWLYYRPFYDPHRSCLSTYATRVINSRIAELIRSRNAAKRGTGQRPESLDVLVKDGDGGWARRGDLLADDGLAISPAGAARQMQTDLRLDVTACVATLPEPLRVLSTRLQTMSVSEVSRRTGVPRSTLYRSVQELRRRFSAAGLKEYLATVRGRSAHNS